MTDVIIVHHFEIFIIIVLGMHINFIILQVLTIMEVPLPRSHIGPCFKCKRHSLKSNIALFIYFSYSEADVTDLSA